MPNDVIINKVLRQDCLTTLRLHPTLAKRLDQHRICIVGGTGFIGTWIAEMVAALNDEFGCQVRVDLFGRSAVAWAKTHRHLSKRGDIFIDAGDVRTSFEISHDTTLVLFAAGVADPCIHASDPYRVHETAVHGMSNCLSATARLVSLHRFVNLSSGLVFGDQMQDHPIKENNVGLLNFARVHNVYAESRRAAENLVSIYASQYRIPVSTARAFTFIGPYQSLDAPWAANNFIRDALAGNDIRLHGDGSTRRSYLYGSDAAAWVLRVLVDGHSGAIYNIGGDRPVSHAEVADIVASLTVPSSRLIYKSQQAVTGRSEDFIPDLVNVKSTLGLAQAFDIELSIKRTLEWHTRCLDVI